jgi:hypothetical protein
MRYKPRVGKELELSKDVIVAKTGWMTELTRSAIALSVISVSLLTLAISAAFSAYRGEYQALQMVWAVVAVPLGCIIGYYFRGNGRNGEEDDARAT